VVILATLWMVFGVLGVGFFADGVHLPSYMLALWIKMNVL
jgi:hypothetical protein